MHVRIQNNGSCRIKEMQLCHPGPRQTGLQLNPVEPKGVSLVVRVLTLDVANQLHFSHIACKVLRFLEDFYSYLIKVLSLLLAFPRLKD